MCRKPRSLSLFDGCTVHKVWQAHNKRFYLAPNKIKEMYLRPLKEITEEKKEEQYTLNAICIMSNHVHEIYEIKSIESFSNLMRRHHSRFGLRFNKLKKMTGKVAKDRPHTTCFETNNHSMEAVFYIHANPFKANVIKDERSHYIFSTHAFYAYGNTPRFLKGINFKLPEWYLNLGKTSKERQEEYRKLFKKYMDKFKSNNDCINYSKTLFCGSSEWEEKNVEIIREFLTEQYKKYNSS